MARRIFEYRDFSGGDYGRLEAWRAPKNTFSATNMLISRTGELCVRPGVRDVSPTGQSNGAIWGMGVRPGTLSDVWYGQANHIKSFTAHESPGAVSTATGTTAVNLSGRPAVDATGATTYVSAGASGTYSYNGSAITTLSSTVGGVTVAQYGDRLILAASASNQIRYSAAADFTAWPAANLITVGDADAINALISQRGHLSILKNNSSHYVLTGVPGVNETLRPIVRAEGPGTWKAAVKVRKNDMIWYVSDQWPIRFDGSGITRVDHVNIPLYLGLADIHFAPFTNDDEGGFALASAGAVAPTAVSPMVWLYSRGAWTKHTFGVTHSNFISAGWDAYPQNGGSDFAEVRYGTKIVLSDGGGASATPKFWSWMPLMDRPGLEASPFSVSAERAGDDSSTPVSGSVTFPEQRDDHDGDLHVRGVIVDFRSWNTGSATNNHFDLTVNCLRSYETAGPVASTTQSFDETASLSSLAGTVRRKYFSFGDQGKGGGFQLALTNVKGVAFQRFTVIADSSPPRY